MEGTICVGVVGRFKVRVCRLVFPPLGDALVVATLHRLVVIALAHGLEMGRCARLHRKNGALSALLVLLLHLAQGKALFYFTSRYAL